MTIHADTRGVEPGTRVVPPRNTAASLTCLLAAILAVMPLLASAPAAASGESFDRRDIRLLVGLNTDSYQVYAQLFGKHLRNRLPDANVVVETDDRAAGKMVAQRVMKAPEGRIVLGMLSNNMFYEYMVGEPESQYVYNPTDFNWIGRFTGNDRVLVTSTEWDLDTLEALRQFPEPLIFPTIPRVMSQNYQEALLLNAVLDLHLYPVPAYGGKATRLALMNGEAHAYSGTYFNLMPVLERGDAVAILKLGGENWNEGVEELPTFRRMASPKYSEVVDFTEFCARFSRWLVASPGISPEDLAALREIFDDIVSDPAFVKELERANAPLSPMSGGKMEKRIREVFGDESLRPALREAVACGAKRAEDINENC